MNDTKKTSGSNYYTNKLLAIIKENETFKFPNTGDFEEFVANIRGKKNELEKVYPYKKFLSFCKSAEPRKEATLARIKFDIFVEDFKDNFYPEKVKKTNLAI